MWKIKLNLEITITIPELFIEERKTDRDTVILIDDKKYI